MKAFKAGPEFEATSIGNSASAISPWSSQGNGESGRQLTTANVYRDVIATSSDVASPPKRHKRRKPRSSSPSTLRSSRATKHKAKSVEGNHTPAIIGVS
ncbi:hypothetical protein HAX54_009417 [Datura stramonium]|uniref:Uncharacterized protein n=1 Tax=Datura stramonium TaxID=4076 RepID=A0ABS8RW47_DATST|nr:hypothetical protein [Datura stramonium]